MGGDAGDPILADLGREGRAGGGEAVHLAQGAKAHIGRQRRLHGVRGDGLISVIDGARGRRAEHLDGAVVLGFDLGNFTVKIHGSSGAPGNGFKGAMRSSWVQV